MAVKLINVFAVPKGEVDEFLKRWNETMQVYARSEGFIDTHLHRNTGVGNQTFNFINIAHWASDEAFVQAHRDYVPGEESIAGISFHPAVFEEIVMTKTSSTRARPATSDERGDDDFVSPSRKQ